MLKQCPAYLKVFLVGTVVVTVAVVDSGCDFLIDRGGFVVERSGRDPLVVYPSGSTTCTLSSFSPFVET